MLIKDDTLGKSTSGRGGRYLKLAAAIGALAAAINGYVELQGNQEALLTVLADRINLLSEKVSYIEGRLDIKHDKFHGVLPKSSESSEEAARPYRAVPGNFEDLKRSIQHQQANK
jgi:hypothetical protein